MNYFQPYPPEVQDVDIAGWESQIATAEREPSLQQLIAGRHNQLFPSFVMTYRALRRLPRGTRRALQRSFARTRGAPCLVNDNISRGLAIGSLAQSLAGIALLVILEQGQADAATINVTTNIPKFAADGRCSLPEAIVNANTDAATYPDCPSGNGSDTIVLPAKSTHQLQTILSSYYGGNGLPLITTAITIEGNGARISRPKNNFHYRLLAVTNSGDLNLNNIRLSGGIEYYGGNILNAGKLTITATTISGGLTAVGGGGVFNARGGTLSISNSVLSKNVSFNGGAIMNFDGEVNIENSTISGNRSGNGGGLSGLGGLMLIRNSEISTNKADYVGGGIHGQNADVILEDCAILQNSADDGGGILTDSGTLSVRTSVISKNKATNRGGGMMSRGGMVTISESEMSTNSATTGAGLSHAIGGHVTVEDSTITSNQSRTQGGGFELMSGELTIINTTISKNRAGAFGGGIANSNGILQVNNSTITGNSARTSGGGAWLQSAVSEIVESTITGNTAVKGGGVYRNLGDPIVIGTRLVMKRNLISGNKATSGSETYNTDVNPVAPLTTEFNLMGVSNNAGIVGFPLGATDIVPAVPIGSILAPLADNGGPTPTHALVAGSPAIDAIPGVLPECAGTDQRGVDRPQGAGCDIGAFEK